MTFEATNKKRPGIPGAFQTADKVLANGGDF
jgi:hypothetical protein